jgi:hypothetical protein
MFESKLNKDKAGGYPSLDKDAKVPYEHTQPIITGITYTDGTLNLIKSDSTEFVVEQVINNFSRTINICENDLLSSGTTEEKILDYLILMDYKKSAYDGDVDVIIESCSSVAIDLDITVYSGSVITVFNYNLSRTLPQDVSLPVELQLGLNSSSTLSIPTDILISGGTLSGGTTITLLDVNYNDLSGVSNLLVGQLSVAYDYVVTGTITFDTPIPGGSGSAGSGGFSFGIGLSNLD